MADLKHVIIGAVIGSIIVKIVTDPWRKKQREETQKLIDETSEMASHSIDDMNQIDDKNQKYVNQLYERLNKTEES